MLRNLLVVLLAVSLAVQVVRTAAVRMLAEAAPATAARVWSDHPDVKLPLGMIDIAVATREGRPVAPSVLSGIYGASRLAPLSPEPFLVRGVEGQMSSNAQLAERAFLAAKWRNNRSRPARYFLADHYLRQGDAARGLREIASLARLAPDGVAKLSPYLATFARDRRNWPQLRSVFRSEPALEDATLSSLATDASNAELVLAPSNPQRLGPQSPWLPVLLDRLTSARRYDTARTLWAKVSAVRSNGPLYDPQFTESRAPPPFNWWLTSSTVGLAERQSGGGLHVIFYGQEDGPLASQLLVLQPGRYRFSNVMTGSPNNAGSLRWRLVCASTNSEISPADLNSAAAGWTFVVPAACPAQKLELFGSSGDTSQQTDVIIRRVQLTPGQPNA